MRFITACFQGKNLDIILEKVAADIKSELDSEKADISFVFISNYFKNEYHKIYDILQGYFFSKCMIGCSAEPIISNEKKIENEPAIMIVSAILPDVEVKSFLIDFNELPNLDESPSVWKNLVNVHTTQKVNFILLGDPFARGIEDFLEGLDYAYPENIKIGGIASGVKKPGDCILFHNNEVVKNSLVGLALYGNLLIDPIMVQGCRPIGKALEVTRCEKMILKEVDGMSPIKYLKKLTEILSEYDKELLQTSLFLGVEASPFNGDFSHGNFLIRNLQGIDPKKGSLVIGDDLEIGQTVQFYLKDKVKSAINLKHQLEHYKKEFDVADCAGALIFTGLGRDFYAQENNDCQIFEDIIGNIPLGGFFSNGEIGPVCNETYIHAYTCSFGFFRQAYTEKEF